jgi:hypothetical protein
MISLVKLSDYRHLREIFNYDPVTGVLTYAKDMPRRGKVGDVCGGVNSRGYRRVSVRGVSCPAHVVIWLWMTGSLPKEDIDHIDGNRSNNSWDNLRSASRSQNLMNQGVKFNNTSGFKGVCSRGNSHSVRFRINGKVVHIGSFNTAEEAASVYDQEVVKHQGVFAKTNRSLGLIP